VQFDLQAWIGFNLLDDFVVPGDEICDCDLAAVRRKFPHFIKIERDKLFDLEDVYTLLKSNVGRQSLCKAESALYRNQNRAMAIVKVFLTAFNDCFARRGRSLNYHIAPNGIAEPVL